MPTFRLLLGTVMQIILLQEKDNLYVVEISSSMWMWGSSMEILLWRSLQRALKKPFCLRCSREPETGQSFSEAYICAISTGIWFIWNVSIWCSRNKECISNYFIASMCQCTFKNREFKQCDTTIFTASPPCSSLDSSNSFDWTPCFRALYAYVGLLCNPCN